MIIAQSLDIINPVAEYYFEGKNNMEKKAIGIIGGMGPLATADVFKKIITNTCAKSDQEHIRVLIDNNTQIPDRTQAILHGGKNPVPQLIKSAISLWAMGAQILVMPCNTAHYFYSQVQKNVDIPVLNMIELTCEGLKKRNIKKVALLATEGTVNSGIYQKVLKEKEIEFILPDSCEQKTITDLIYKGVKSGNKDFDISGVKNALDNMMEKGAQVLILGCTELPVAMEMYKLDYPVCDPTLELARGAIIAAGGKCVKLQ